MQKLNYSPIHSSWNSDRVAACHVSRTHKARATRKPYLYAQYRDNEVSVCGARGKARFTIRFDNKIISAIVKDDRLIVTTADDCVRYYDAHTKQLLGEVWPTPPGDGTVNAAFSLAA